MSDTIFVEGIRVFPPHEKAPDFVKASLIITPRELIDFLKSQADNMTEYNGKKQLKCQMLEGRSGLYLSVDTYKRDETPAPPTAEDVQAETQAQEDPEDKLPF